MIVGQTPPPYGGQAIMIERILNFQSDELRFFHVRMHFSSEMNDIGKVQIKKFFELFRVIATIWKYRIFHNVRILYYPPAGPNTVPILRDVLILLSTRFLFRKTIFHFHAGGLSEKFSSLKPILRLAFRKAYFYPDLTIRLSKLNPNDGVFLRTKKDIIIPYGIDDESEKIRLPVFRPSALVSILYTGILQESKGISVLIKAARLLLSKGCSNFELLLMGRFESKQYEHEVQMAISENGLGSYIKLLGVRTGNEKLSVFQQCDIFCFPSFFESETFGIVLLEAMQFAKPVVATNWRGIPDIVCDGITGFLVAPKCETSLAAALLKLIADENLRRQFGMNGRNRLKERFTTEHFKRNFQTAIMEGIE